MGRLVFITGTDTGVGKTVVTALLLAHAQNAGTQVRALKPFCSGSRADAGLLAALQGVEPDQINPFYFSEPIAPRSAARRAGRRITLDQTLEFIRAWQSRCDLLLIEGAGGLLAPLGEHFDAGDLIQRLRAQAVLVAPNRLGVLNHARLTIEALRSRTIHEIKLAFPNLPLQDESSRTNLDDLRDLVFPIPVVSIPAFADYRAEPDFIRAAAKKVPRLVELVGGGETRAK